MSDFYKEAKIIQWKEESSLSKWCSAWVQLEFSWSSACRRMQEDPYLSPSKILMTKWIKDIDINPVSLNNTKEKIWNSLKHMGTGDNFLNITQRAQTLKATINKWDLMKLRSFCKSKDRVNKIKQQPTEFEMIFTNPTSDRGLISKIYKEETRHQNIK